MIFRHKARYGWRGDVARVAKQGSEGVEEVEAAVEAERELIEVRLQVLRADAVMDAAQPGFELGEHEMDDGQKKVLRCLEWGETVSGWQVEVELSGEQIDDGLEVSR